MDRDTLITRLSTVALQPDQVLYLERRGEEYAFSVVGSEAALRPGDGTEAPLDSWIYYSGAWSTEDQDRFVALVDDLIDEMDSMSGGSDRCRWPLDQPYPQQH
ncbi:MAG: hypothetical protein ACR2HR_13575 [Euzebya sp.]